MTRTPVIPTGHAYGIAYFTIFWAWALGAITIIRTLG